MIIRGVMIGVLLVLAITAQTALFPLLPTAWFRPDLVLLVVVGVALSEGPLSGLRVGFVGGLLTDLLTTLSPAGITTLVLTVVGFVVGSVRPYLATSSLTAPLIVAFSAGLIGTAATGTLALLLGDERVSAAMLLQASFAVAVFNVVLAPLALPLVHRLFERFPRRVAGPE